MNSESVDLIYLDPPFNSKTNYAAPIGSKAAGAAFKDTWTLKDIDIAWLDLIETKHPQLHKVILAAMTKSDQSYLIYMAIRLLEMKRLLKLTGNIYLHCDPTMSHYLKLVMDAIFGKKHFRNEIVWCYTGPNNSKKQFQRKHDIILFYGMPEGRFYPDYVRQPYKTADPLHLSRGFGNPTEEEIAEIQKRLRKGKIPTDWWADGFISNISGWRNELTGYPTQKPLELLRRIILASSDEGDMVLDPFCGCATTCIAATMPGKRLKPGDRPEPGTGPRQWVGIDISPKAAELVATRLYKEVGGLIYKGPIRDDIPKRTDIGKLPPYNCKKNRDTLYGKQGGYCTGCHEHFPPHHLEVDHIIAKTKGGGDDLGNLQLLCPHCNRVKGNQDMEYLIARLEFGPYRPRSKPEESVRT